ncbi:MarR family winged helix-turn-helix transcriptional regulator [Microbispora sp. ATCC PTA-5024]|uniref:MarR family winged helix-turn-helix transcriptional regulator n=1 Tax=Microbispora sp. ATCC PTA-5024 TaxID=316330 RepID=UPI001E5D0457|nr:MarR family transcriptional regulator [Microbispora sp. ATCC PTA-5024]
MLVSISARSLAAAEDRLTLPQFRMLLVLGRAETKLVTLAERLAVNSSTAMRMADRLAAAGFLQREVNPHNRRETLLRLTDSGRQIVDEVSARRKAEIGAIISRMSPAKRRALIAAMKEFNEAAGEPPAHVPFPLGWPDTQAP